MQLFNLEQDLFKIKCDTLELSNVQNLLSQLRKVLRSKKWDHISVQFYENNETKRFEIEIEDWTDKDLIGKIIESQIFSIWEKETSMFIAMPNKREKAELITQKLTEIWISNIYFWISEHSVIRQRNEKKAERLEKISREAVEQSRWFKQPNIIFLKNEKEIKSAINWKKIFIANMWWKPIYEYKKDLWNNNICGIIWPEGWFSEKDLNNFWDVNIVDLWNNILRMETAAIVLAWLLKN